MKINFIKQAGGVLVPASDMEADRLNKLKTGELYTVELKYSRNPAFHRKVFAFFNFCFENFQIGEQLENMNEQAQFDRMRKDLTCLAGPSYRNEVFNIKGELRVEAKSIAFSSMSEEEFQNFYVAVTNAAMRNIFKTSDQNIFNKLMSFF